MKNIMYKCEKKVLYPPVELLKCNSCDEYKSSVVVDKCLSDEIERLWSKGVKTTGCCCGHGINLGFIEVRDECIEIMEQLGYVHYIYPEKFGGVERKDAFIPKTYGHIYSGFCGEYFG